MSDRKRPIQCSFCGKDRKQVNTMVAGSDVYICDECIELCADVVDEEHSRRQSSKSAEAVLADIPTPEEMYNRLNE